MASIGNLVANLTMNTAQFTRGTAVAQSSIRSLTGTVTTSVRAITAAFAPVAAVVGAAFAIPAAISGGKAQLQAEQKLAAVLAATGGAAGLTAKEIGEYASELQSATNYGDDATIAAASVLATFKEIKGDTFKAAIASAQDLSTVMGQDLQSSVVQLGKALNDPTRGITALSRVGVSFTQQQKDQIKAMQEAGDVAGAQQVILAELKSEFGGAAAALADPWTQAKNTIGDVGDNIGLALLPSINVVAKAMDGVAGTVANARGVFESFGAKAGEVLSAFVNATSASFTAFASLSGSTLGTVGEYAVSLFNAIADGAIVGFTTAEVMIQNFGKTSQTAFAFGQLAMLGFAGNVSHFFTQQLPGWLTWFGENWSDVFFTVGDYALTIFANLGENIRGIWQSVLDYFQGKPVSLNWKPLTEGAFNAIKELPDIPERVVSDAEMKLADEVAALTSDIGKDVADKIAARRGTQPGVPAFAAMGGVDNMEVDQGGLTASKSTNTGPSLALQGTSDALKSIFDNMRRAGATPEEQTEKNTAKAASEIAELRKDLKRSPGIRFVGVG